VGGTEGVGALHGLVLGLHLLSSHSPSGYEDLSLLRHGQLLFAGDPLPRRRYKTWTPGLYVADPRAGWVAGLYRNSYGDLSVYGGALLQTEDGRFALTVGAATGYRAAALVPIFSPSVKFSELPLRLSYLPKAGAASAHVIHLSVEKEF